MTLADDFIGPEDDAAARPGATYSRRHLKTFEHTLPAREELVSSRHGFMLAAGPPEPLSLLGIRVLNPEYFFPKTRGWYCDERERFSRDQTVTTKWLNLRKGVQRVSRGMNRFGVRLRALFLRPSSWFRRAQSQSKARQRHRSHASAWRGATFFIGEHAEGRCPIGDVRLRRANTADRDMIIRCQGRQSGPARCDLFTTTLKWSRSVD